MKLKKTRIILLIMVLLFFITISIVVVKGFFGKNNTNKNEIQEINLDGSKYIEKEMENDYPFSNDPAKKGLLLNSEDKLYDFVCDSSSCGTPVYVHQLTWNDLSIDVKKLNYKNDGTTYPVGVKIDEENNYFILDGGYLIVYNIDGKEISKIRADSSYDTKFYIEGEILYLLLSNKNVKKYNWVDETLLDEYELDNLKDIVYFDEYTLSYDENKLIVSDNKGNKVNEIILPDKDTTYKYKNEYGDMFIYNKQLVTIRNDKIYYSCVGGIYVAGIDGNEFFLLIDAEKTEYLIGDTYLISMVVDSNENIYLSYDEKHYFSKGSGMVKYEKTN